MRSSSAVVERTAVRGSNARCRRAATASVGRRVARLMRQDGLRARVVRVYRGKAGVHRWFSRQPNHVRRMHATRPNQIWVGDVTYLGVSGRWWYLVVVLDQCSRRVLAWRLAATRDSRVTRAVLDAALRRRRPDAGLIFHTRPRQRVSGNAGAHSVSGERGAPEHDAWRRPWRERPHGVVLPLAQGRRHPRPIVSSPSPSFASSSVATCSTTTTSACIRRWAINHPLTMNDEPRRSSPVY